MASVIPVIFASVIFTFAAEPSTMRTGIPAASATAASSVRLLPENRRCAARMTGNEKPCGVWAAKSWLRSSVVATWLDTQVTDTDAYVETVAPLIEDPALQQALSRTITARVFEALDVPGVTQTDQQNGQVLHVVEEGIALLPPGAARRVGGPRLLSGRADRAYIRALRPAAAILVAASVLLAACAPANRSAESATADARQTATAGMWTYEWLNEHLVEDEATRALFDARDLHHFGWRPGFLDRQVGRREARSRGESRWGELPASSAAATPRSAHQLGVEAVLAEIKARNKGK